MRGVLFGGPVFVGAALHVRHPIRIRQIPGHRLAYASLKRFRRLPAQFTLDLAGVDGLAPVMAGSVLDGGDLGAVGGAVGLGAQLVVWW